MPPFVHHLPRQGKHTRQLAAIVPVLSCREPQFSSTGWIGNTDVGGAEQPNLSGSIFAYAR